jgi:hypothetical protein
VNDADIFSADGGGSFAPAAGTMNAARAKHSAVSMSNGQVFLAGGENDTGFLTSTEYFDPATNTFVVNLGSQPAFGAPREEHSGTRLPDTRILHAGGSTAAGGLTLTLDTAEIAGAAMTTTGSLTGPRRIHTATPLDDHTVLLAGGASSVAGPGEVILNTAEVFHFPVFVDPTPSFSLLNISNVQLNGGGNVLVLPGGGSFTLEHDYFIANPADCPSCIQQIEVGPAGGAYQACTYDDIPPVAGISGHGSATLTVPSTAGLYYIGFDEAFTFFCGQFPDWWSGPPTPSRYMAIVIVP